MNEYHDSNHYRRQRLIGSWAIMLVIELVAVEVFIYSLMQMFDYFHFLGRRPNKETLPYMYLGIGVVILLYGYIRLTHSLEKFDAKILGKDSPSSQKAQQDSSSALSDFPELKQAASDGLIAEDGTLQVFRSDFVIYCQEHNFFPPRNKESGWKPIDGLLIDQRTGKRVTARQLRQTYQDLGRDGRVPID